MSVLKKIPVEEFKELLSSARVISVDYGALLTSWRSDEICLLEATETNCEGPLRKYYIPMDEDLEIVVKGNIFIVEWDDLDGNSLMHVQLYKITPITAEEG